MCVRAQVHGGGSDDKKICTSALPNVADITGGEIFTYNYFLILCME